MAYIQEEKEWDALSNQDKKKELFLSQKGTLDLFLEKGAITRAQYDKSFGDLKRLMGFEDFE